MMPEIMDSAAHSAPEGGLLQPTAKAEPVVERMPVVDPRLLQIATVFRAADERKKELIYRQVVSMPCPKEPA